MTEYLNPGRPPLFCPGCSHDKVVHGLAGAMQSLHLVRDKVVIVTDIGCSGLFDTFFTTHAFHGLHGRALTYATGIKTVRPELSVIVIMGDGGLGIGGAHLLAACRRNLDITLLVLNNFNYGMTGGQCSATTPRDSLTSSGFLNQLEEPLDLCRVAVAAGGTYTHRVMATDKELPIKVAAALEWKGFSIMDIWGVCPGRHLKKNPMTLKQLEKRMRQMNRSLGIGENGLFTAEGRSEFGTGYRRLAAAGKRTKLRQVDAVYDPLLEKRYEVLILGAAGQYINTIGEILCFAAMSSGLHVTQKNDYPITVLRGHSVSEVVLSAEPVEYTGLFSPDVVICLAPEGVARRQSIFRELEKSTVILRDKEVQLPDTKAKIIDMDFSGKKTGSGRKGIAALVRLAKMKTTIHLQMLKAGISARYSGKMYGVAMDALAEFSGGGEIDAEKGVSSRK